MQLKMQVLLPGDLGNGHLFGRTRLRDLQDTSGVRWTNLDNCREPAASNNAEAFLLEECLNMLLQYWRYH